MDYELIIRPEARTDLLDTFQWYQEQRSGLGFDFKLCIDEVLSNFKSTPLFIKKYIKIFEERLLKDSCSAYFTLLKIMM